MWSVFTKFFRYGMTDVAFRFNCTFFNGDFMMNLWQKWVAVVVCIAVIPFVVGCQQGPNTSRVTGTVLIDGQAVEGVSISFQPQSPGRPAVGYTDAQGKYELHFTMDSKGCIPGMNTVFINAYSNPDSDTSQYLPKKYNAEAAKNPDMNVDVKPGRQVFDFNVSTKE